VQGGGSERHEERLRGPAGEAVLEHVGHVEQTRRSADVVVCCHCAASVMLYAPSRSNGL
jgi:hypothetical protein